MNARSATGLVKREQPGETVASKPRPLRIVMVNHETLISQCFDIVIRHWFKDVTVLMFDKAVDALAELSRTEPDLLITYDLMPEMSGRDVCRLLLDKGVRYPIIALSTYSPTKEWVRELSTRGLNVSYLPCPCTTTELRTQIETSLRIPIEGVQASQPVATAPPASQEGRLERDPTKSSRSEQQ